jgi:signal transduction histidine kinase
VSAHERLRSSLARIVQRRKPDATAEIIATVSHEIRSPLTTIKGFTKTLIDRWDRLSDEAKLDMLRAVNADADRVTRLLTELLEVSRIEAGKLQLRLQRVDVRELAESVVTEMATRSEKHTVRLADGDTVEARADPDKMRQVLNNLVENALKYTDGGDVVVAYVQDESWVEVSVRDEGPGIPVSQQKDLFGKFARRELAGAPSGTGLGLYISKALIEAHDGEMGVSSKEDTGSTFWFRVPLAE